MRKETSSQPAECCPLCGARDGVLSFAADPRRPYLRCGTCGLIFVPRACHPSPTEARRRYDLHRNNPDDAGYRSFLNQLVEPLAARLPAGAEGLDFGSGPCPVLSLLLAGRGFRMSQYDPLYAPEPAALNRRYDFVACSETVEHFTNPARDLDIMLSLVREGGWIGIMTGMVAPGTDFARWRYANDITHVCFYTQGTFEWWAARRHVAVEFPAPNVCLLRVPEAGP